MSKVKKGDYVKIIKNLYNLKFTIGRIYEVIDIDIFKDAVIIADDDVELALYREEYKVIEPEDKGNSKKIQPSEFTIKLSEKELCELVIKELGMNVDLNDYGFFFEWEKGNFTINFEKK